MNGRDPERLYRLLPAICRIRDQAQGEPLRALLGVVEEELRTVEADIERLYENWFIETCQEWVVPYIGDLVGNRPLHEVTRTRRADVAKTLYYRRRKGTLAMLEEMARDVTGWGVHAVAFFELLGWTQHLNHLRSRAAPRTGRAGDAVVLNPHAVTRVGTVNLRAPEALGRLDTPFDETTHTVDVRRTERTVGKYNIRNVGFFLWRLRSYPMRNVAARRASTDVGFGFHFSPYGAPTPLFVQPDREAVSTALAEEIHIAAPLRPEAFAADLRAYRERHAGVPAAHRPVAIRFYGPARSLHIVRDGEPVPPEAIVPGPLATWCRPRPGTVGVDVEQGRLIFPPEEGPVDVRVSFSYGFSADIGGGPYDRRTTLTGSRPGIWTRTVADAGALADELALWREAAPAAATIRVEDGVYHGSVGTEGIDLPPGSVLNIEAVNFAAPHLRIGDVLQVTAPAAGATLVLNGLHLEGGLRLRGNVTLRLLHCTLVPGGALDEDGAPGDPTLDSVAWVASDAGLPQVTIAHSIVGALRLPAEAAPLLVEDSIVQALAVGERQRAAIAASDDESSCGPPATLRRSTVFGPVLVRELQLASEVIFTSAVWAERRQTGCVRFSVLPAGSRTPRRYRSQPDLALAGVRPAAERARIRRRLMPRFTSVRFGDPAYAQLSAACHPAIRTGAEDGSEMGVFSQLKQPQREANLRTRLDEYLPFGLEAGLVYVT